MRRRTIYIAPQSEDHTGYSTHVSVGSSTSAFEDLSFRGETVLPALAEADEERQVQNQLFPETHEERFLDEDLARFLKKKGY